MRKSAKVPVRPVSALSAAVGALLGASSIASAQQLDEIIVTAERRELSLQETPISVMAFDGESLELQGVDDMFELATLTPNLEIKGARGSGNTSPIFEIRGISGGGGATGERGVGFYVDNVFMPRSTGPVMRVLDVERVEVLRGPQGTLFGRNSTGGAIRVFSKQPGPDRDAYLKVTGGNFDHYDLSGMINLPLTDELYLRGQVASLHEDGFLERGPQMLGGSEDTVARLQLAWRPSDALTVSFGAMHSDSDSDGSATDMTIFNMDPVCPLNPADPTYCLQGNYADWVSDFLQTSGQGRLQQNDPRLVLDDFTMPDFCFLDDANPDWDDLCLQWNKAKYTQVDANVTWEITDRLTMISTTGVSDFSSSGVSDWQLVGMEFRPSGVESEVLYQAPSRRRPDRLGRRRELLQRGIGLAARGPVRRGRFERIRQQRDRRLRQRQSLGLQRFARSSLCESGSQASCDRRRFLGSGRDGLRNIRERHASFQRARESHSRRAQISRRERVFEHAVPFRQLLTAIW
jgi:outer membrane receptor protein involved in Fe transport